jgi:hypothetical protein
VIDYDGDDYYNDDDDRFKISTTNRETLALETDPGSSRTQISGFTTK